MEQRNFWKFERTLMLFVLIYAVIVHSVVSGDECIEVTKPHITQCDKYFECLELPPSGHVWIPKQCEKGLIYDTTMKTCVLPGDDWECLLPEEEEEEVEELLNDRDDQNVFGVDNLDFYSSDETTTSSQASDFFLNNDMDTFQRKNLLHFDSPGDGFDEIDFESSGDGPFSLIEPKSTEKLSQILSDMRESQNHRPLTPTVGAEWNPYKIMEILKMQGNISSNLLSTSTPAKPMWIGPIPYDENYKYHQIIVNHPEGSVLFHTPPFITTESPPPKTTTKDRNTEISEDLIKTLLEISKHIAINREQNRPLPPHYLQPIILTVPVPEKSPQRPPERIEKIESVHFQPILYPPGPAFHPPPIPSPPQPPPPPPTTTTTTTTSAPPESSRTPSVSIVIGGHSGYASNHSAYQNPFRSPGEPLSSYGLPIDRFPSWTEPPPPPSMSPFHLYNLGRYRPPESYGVSPSPFQVYQHQTPTPQTYYQPTPTPPPPHSLNIYQPYQPYPYVLPLGVHSGMYQDLPSTPAPVYTTIKRMDLPLKRKQRPQKVEQQHYDVSEYYEDDANESLMSGSDDTEEGVVDATKPLEKMPEANYEYSYRSAEGVVDEESDLDMNKYVSLGGTIFSYQNYKEGIRPLLQSDKIAQNVDIITCVRGSRQPNSTDCTKYYVCSPTTKQVLSYNCPDYTAFNPVGRICDAETYSHCVPSAVKAKVTVNVNKRLQQQALQAIQDANKIRAEAIKAQQLANMQPTGSSNNGVTIKRKKVKNKTKRVTTKRPWGLLSFDTWKDRLESYVPFRNRRRTTPVPVPIQKPSKRLTCLQPGKVPDPDSPIHYYVCIKTDDGFLKLHRLQCPTNFFFCAKKLLCSMPSDYGNC